jgi:hypothetical protein
MVSSRFAFRYRDTLKAVFPEVQFDERWLKRTKWKQQTLEGRT